MSTIFGAISVETPKYSVLRSLPAALAEVRRYAPQGELFDPSPSISCMLATLVISG
jgi:hypothetical protein